MQELYRQGATSSLLRNGREVSNLYRGGRRIRQPGMGLGDDATWRSRVLLKIVQFLALMLTALALIPAGAHLFALANKISLAADQYFIVQSIYRGWALLGIALVGALLANLALAILLRGRGAPFVLALVAFLCIALSLVIFFTWTYPANQATRSWTAIPANWQQLRRQWEYSHAADAIVTFAAFCSLVLSVLATRK